jgi:hypothetical protein
MPSIYFAYDKVEFSCDVTSHLGPYLDFHLAWYDATSEIGGESTTVYKKFMLVSKGEGFAKVSRNITIDGLNLTLSDLPLKLLFERNGGAMYLFCQILNPLKVHPGSTTNSYVDLVSFTEVLRRLTIWGYEDVKGSFKEFIKFDEFIGYSEEQMLQTDNLLKLKKRLEGL